MGNSKTGVWLDTKKAIVVKLEENDHTFKVIDSGIQTKEREEGETKKFGRFAKQFLSFEKNKQRKQSEQEKKFFKEILKEVANSESLVLFGPSNAKLKLEKEIRSNKSLKFDFQGAKDADSMTDNQVKAWVTDFYTE